MKILTKILTKILCLLGMHGPNFFGNTVGNRSAMTASFERTCMECGAVWHGREVETQYYRTIGDWVRVK
jgi:hypothetical protein